MKKEIYMSKKDLDKILNIVEKNELDGETFKIIQENDSGIGYTTAIEFDYFLNGRNAVVRMDIVTSDDW
jgi:hypothetical protein